MAKHVEFSMRNLEVGRRVFVLNEKDLLSYSNRRRYKRTEVGLGLSGVVARLSAFLVGTGTASKTFAVPSL